MGCEIGSINGYFKSRKQVENFIEFFNSIMEEKEDFFEEDHLISMDDVDECLDEDGNISMNDPDNFAFYCELDIWGRFADTYQTWLQFVAAELVRSLPEESFLITYNRDWDNSSESYYEEYDYNSGKLAIKSREEDFSFSDEDYDDEDDEEDEMDDFEEVDGEKEILFDKKWLIAYANGKFTQLSGEADEVIAQAFSINE